MKQLLFIIALTFSLLSTTLSAEPATAGNVEVQDEVTVNINTADATTLASSLNGIGNVKAQAIVKFRDANGPFANAKDLGKVQGIGPATIASNQRIIVVK